MKDFKNVILNHDFSNTNMNTEKQTSKCNLFYPKNVANSNNLNVSFNSLEISFAVIDSKHPVVTIFPPPLPDRQYSDDPHLR